jgi:hypothetical protein
MEEAHSPIFRARDAAVTGAAQVQREDRPEHQRTLSWGSSVSYDESCRVSIRSEGTFDQRQSSKMGSEHEGESNFALTDAAPDRDIILDRSFCLEPCLRH